nr:hypothetical protein [Streptomyces niveiscabiei]
MPTPASPTTAVMCPLPRRAPAMEDRRASRASSRQGKAEDGRCPCSGALVAGAGASRSPRPSGTRPHLDGGRGGRPVVEFVAQQRHVDVLEFAGWGDPELLGEVGARPVVQLERLGLPAQPVQARHEAADEAFVGGVQGHLAAQQRDGVTGLAEREQRVGVGRHGGGPQQAQACALLRERGVGREVQEGVGPP